MTVAPYSAGTDWQATVHRVTDGDTIRVFRSRTVQLADGLAARIHDDPAQLPDGLPVRVINLNTPERGKPGWAQAGADARDWLAAAETGPGLMVTTWGTTGGFDRLLGDFWTAGDRADTLTQWMLRDRGWPPYIEP